MSAGEELAHLEAWRTHWDTTRNEWEQLEDESQADHDARFRKLQEESDELYEKLVEENIFPRDNVAAWETALYPDYIDPEFQLKLLSKREFQESKQDPIPGLVDKEGRPIDWTPEKSADFWEKALAAKESESANFELSPVQRFVSRLLNPRTPFNSALLFHGVGVGKTCAAVTIAESYLEMFPRDKIYITAPPTIQAGFKSEIFNFGADTFTMTPEGEANLHRGCTGKTYLELTNSVYEKTRTTIEARVATKINSRYEFFGYTQLYNFIKKIMKRVPATVSGLERTQRENKELQREFSGRVLIIDEAHNLRDLPDESSDENVDAPDLGDMADADAGKRLTPYLMRVLDAAEGMTLILMTATPMYNSYREIIFILNLLLRNDKRATLNEDDIFFTSGKHAGTFKPGGEEILGRIASCYVSYMRGENPFSFPVRLSPSDDVRFDEWATTAPNGEPVETKVAKKEKLIDRCLLLPLVKCSFLADTETEYKQYSDYMMEEGHGGLGIANVDALIQAGNFIFPKVGEEDDIRGRYGAAGFERTFREEKHGSEVVYRTIEEDASWMRADELAGVSGKAAFLIERLRTCEGVAFVYSRFVASGALSIALCLEANGYTPWGRDMGFLGNGIQARGGRQCALCEKKEMGHAADADHPFTPAKYVMLTGSDKLSTNNAASIRAARAVTNKNGADIKVILGSQIAGEGLNLRFIRELYVYDSWFHLNKLEQVIGRGVRTQSHALLPEEKRNCTIYLLVNRYDLTPDEETIDMYSYRRALVKAIQMGKVTRVLKRYALDCSLNYAGIRMTGLPMRILKDAQGEEKEVDVNDIEFSSICDWIECDYACSVDVKLPLKDTDTSTYDEYAARWRVAQIKKTLSNLFARRTFLKQEDLESIFGNVPRILLGTIMKDITTNPDFTIITPKGEGRIVYRNEYYIFQPLRLQSDPVPIPLAVRMAPYPVKRDSFVPELKENTALRGVEGDGVGAVPEREKRNGEGKRGDEEEGDKGEDLSELWTHAKEWADSIESGTASGESMPEELFVDIRRISGDNSKLLRQRKERLDMITWIYPLLVKTPSLRREFALVVKEYIWDEFLNATTQKSIVLGNEELEAGAPRTTKWELEGTTYVRIYNSDTGKVEIYVDGEPAARSILEILEGAVDRDPIRSRPIRPSTTGTQYGFLVKKKADMIFKIALPPAPGKKKVERGARCSIDSNISYQIGKLVELGQVLMAMKLPTLDLDEHTLTKVRPFKNSTRACTLLDLVLRWMDLKRVGGKRWFYRPLEAALLGHESETR